MRFHKCYKAKKRDSTQAFRQRTGVPGARFLRDGVERTPAHSDSHHITVFVKTH